MRKITAAALLAALCLLLLAGCSAAEDGGQQNDTETAGSSSLSEQQKDELARSMTDNESIEKAKEIVVAAYREEHADRKDELENGEITIGEITMRVNTQVIGEPGEEGYPLYIALHGGGQGDTPDINDDQWEQMFFYYSESVTSGVYVATRGIRDTWNTHFNDESYSFYDRIITDAVSFYGVDPNRVYLVGFSAGGDGVYAIAPRMADRFAAVNMSSGHPNDVSLINMSNLPIFIQVGEEDTAYDRHLYAAKYDAYLDELADQLGTGYPHETFIHVGMGHNYPDNGDEDQAVVENISEWLENGGSGGGVVYKDTNAVRLTSACVRDPLPQIFIWEIGMNAPQREVTSFYWLGRDDSLQTGTVIAGYDRDSNTVAIAASDDIGDGTLKVYVNSDMLDIFSPITLNINGNEQELQLVPSFDMMEETMEERGDPNYVFPAGIEIEFQGDSCSVKTS